MNLSTVVRSERFVFADLREVFAKANEEKSGRSARRARGRVGARAGRGQARPGRRDARARSSTSPLIDPDHDDVSRLILDTLDRAGFRRDPRADRRRVPRVPARRRHDRAPSCAPLQPAITPEIAAAVAKLMSNKDLVLAASKIRNVTRCRNTLGERGRPRHPRPAEPPGRRPGRHPARRPSMACCSAAATR